MPTFSALIGILWTVFIAYWLISAIGVKKNIQKRRGVVFRFFLMIVFIVAFSVVFSTHAFQTLDREVIFSNPFIQCIGTILCILGLSLAVWARKYLGKNWGMPMTNKEGAELVTTGPYAYIRNPIYSGIFLAVFGSALVGGLEWIFFFVFYFIYFFYSAKVEEKIMLEKFPDAYPAYKKRTKMLIPFIF